MAKIKVKQIEDLSLLDGTITIGANSLTPLTSVDPATPENSIVTGLSASGNKLVPVYKTFADLFSILDGTATIASVAEGVVTLKAGIVEANGVIDNSTAADITLAKVATTGAAADVSIADAGNIITATTVEGALAEIAAEIDTMDLASTAIVSLVNGTALQASKISETDGKVTVETAATLVEFNQALSADNKAATMKDITDSAISGQDAIKVENKVVSLVIDGADKVLTQGANGLLANLSLEYDSTNKLIKLLGKTTGEGESASPVVIDTIDATDFIKDGMLDEAEYVELAEGEVEGQDAGKYIVLTFNTASGKEPIYVDVTALVDTYTAKVNDWIVLTGHEFSHKLQSGLPEVAQGITEAVTGTGAYAETKTFKVPQLTVDTAGHVTAVNEKAVSITLPAAQTITGETAIENGSDLVSTAVTATKVEGTDNYTLTSTSTVTTQAVSTASETADGLATALDVKQYVDGKVANQTTEEITVTQIVRGTATTDSVTLSVPEGYTIDEVNTVGFLNGQLVPEVTVSGNTVTYVAYDEDVAYEEGDRFDVIATITKTITVVKVEQA